MAMGVAHAGLFRIQGEKEFHKRALRTADAIGAKLTDGQGRACWDDRDAWANGSFRRGGRGGAVATGGSAPAHRNLLRRPHARAIPRAARTQKGTGLLLRLLEWPLDGTELAVEHIGQPGTADR